MRLHTVHRDHGMACKYAGNEALCPTESQWRDLRGRDSLSLQVPRRELPLG